MASWLRGGNAATPALPYRAEGGAGALRGLGLTDDGYALLDQADGARRRFETEGSGSTVV